MNHLPEPKPICQRAEFDKSIKLYLDAGWPLVLLKRNRKFLKKETTWDSQTIYPDDGYAKARKHYDEFGNFAIRLDIPNTKTGDRLLVIDVDNSASKGKVGDSSYARLRGLLKDLRKPDLKTPSGGHHTYILIGADHPLADAKIKKAIKPYDDIDFLYGRKLALIPGSIIDGKGYKFYKGGGLPKDQIADGLADVVANGENTKPATDDGDDEDYGVDGDNGQQQKKKKRRMPKTIGGVKDLLDLIDPCQFDKDYDGWVKVGMSLHSLTCKRTFSRLSDDLLELWIDWSRRSAKYESDAKMRKDAEYKWRESFSGEKLSILHIIRLAVRGARKRFLFMSNGSVVYDTRDRIKLSPVGFSSKYYPAVGKGAFQLLSEQPSVDVNDHRVDVVDVVCAPGKESFFVDDDGYRVLGNSWNPSTLPPVAESISAEAKERGNFLCRHMVALASDWETYDGLMRWVAFQRQCVGRKVGWAPLLIGPPGSGKSTIIRLIELLIGRANVKIASAGAACGDFNDGIVDSQVVAFEDYNAKYHESSAFSNNMKTPITENRVEKHSKGQSRINIPHHTNYILCSNEARGVVIKPGDRRWLPVRCGTQTPEAFVAKAKNKSGEASSAEVKAYYGRLAECRRRDDLQGEVIKYFMDIPRVKQLLDDMDKPPMNAVKLNMSKTSGVFGEDELMDLIETGGMSEQGIWCKDVVIVGAVAAELSRQLAERGSKKSMESQSVSNILLDNLWQCAGRHQITLPNGNVVRGQVYVPGTPGDKSETRKLVCDAARKLSGDDDDAYLDNMNLDEHM